MIYIAVVIYRTTEGVYNNIQKKVMHIVFWTCMIIETDHSMLNLCY